MPDAVTAKLAQWGLDLASLTALSVLTVALVELVKKHMSVKGPTILVAVVASSFVWSVVFYYPAWFPTVLVATLLTAITASGAWQGAKTLIGKVGEDANKPLGAGDRLIDQ